MYFIRHAHGIHQVAHEMVDKKLARSSKEALGCDIPNRFIPLSPFGRWQAMETGKQLNLNPDHVYTSYIERAIETARLIFPNHEIRKDGRLNEKDFGPAHLMGDEELMQHFPAHYERYRRDGKFFAAKAPGGENYVYLMLRTHSMLDTFRRDCAGKTIAIVGHSAAMLANRQLFEHREPDDLLELGEREWIDNCGILHYAWPSRLWGWQRGKFRIRLKQPPYVLWNVKEEQQEEFDRQALEEIRELRKIYSK
jgi:broad specificity phosphatase PhoE